MINLKMLLLIPFLGLAATAQATISGLWGTNGELWSARSRLPDFSYAGYHCGEQPVPELPAGVSVKQFGARGDGVTDDTRAFQAAIAAVTHGAIEIPPGRYVITDILTIAHRGVVLRGAGTDQTTLYFPKPLQEIKPHWSATTGGLRTSEYSWDGGLVWFQGDYGSKELAKVTAAASRGDTALQVADASGLNVGQRVEFFESDNPNNSLATELYSGDPGAIQNLLGSTAVSFVVHITRIEGNEVYFDRPLRFAVKLPWHPCLRQFEPAVSESGVENLRFEFPNSPYRGHFTEPGFNAVAFTGVADCWARHLLITNADSGIFVRSCFCTVQDVVLASTREPDKALHCTGHHGLNFYGADNLLTGFDCRTRFVHDVSVDRGAIGNVVVHGRGVDLCLDHHCRTPAENLFTDLDAGAGTRLWQCGGGDALGKHCGARGTFWNIRAARLQKYPPAAFGPSSMNLVALPTAAPSEMNPVGRWFEAIPPAEISPPDLYTAQLARRLGH